MQFVPLPPVAARSNGKLMRLSRCSPPCAGVSFLSEGTRLHMVRRGLLPCLPRAFRWQYRAIDPPPEVAHTVCRPPHAPELCPPFRRCETTARAVPAAHAPTDNIITYENRGSCKGERASCVRVADDAESCSLFAHGTGDGDSTRHVDAISKRCVKIVGHQLRRHECRRGAARQRRPALALAMAP